MERMLLYAVGANSFALPVMFRVEYPPGAQVNLTLQLPSVRKIRQNELKAIECAKIGHMHQFDALLAV